MGSSKKVGARVGASLNCIVGKIVGPAKVDAVVVAGVGPSVTKIVGVGTAVA